jgi:hypothetical protein
VEIDVDKARKWRRRRLNNVAKESLKQFGNKCLIQEYQQEYQENLAEKIEKGSV